MSKLLALALLAAQPAFGLYSYARSITIHHAKVGTINNTDQSDFPVGIIGTYSYLATTAHSGDVTNASGYDINFFSDAGLNTPLACEQDTYTATTGAVVYWVRVPTVSHSVDTVIYMAYGNSGISTPQCAGSTVWDSHFKAVYHFGDGATLSLADSTSNANTLTNSGATATSGDFGGAAAFNGTTSTLYTALPTASLTPTISAWTLGRASSSSVAVLNGINDYVAGHTGNGYGLWSNSGYIGTLFPGVAYSGFFTQPASDYQAMTASAGSGISYVGRAGSFGANTTISGTPLTPTGLFSMGCTVTTATPTFGYCINFPLDEVRISDIDRGPDWLITEYNDGASPSTFYTISSPPYTPTGVQGSFPIIY